MHGTTVATNTILTGTGAKVGLITTKGYRQVLQIARSFVPGGLGGWVIYNKSDPLAPLALTIEADERMSAKGEVLSKLKKGQLAKDIKELSKKGVEAITVSLINSYANDQHEKEIKSQIRKKKLFHFLILQKLKILFFAKSFSHFLAKLLRIWSFYQQP